MSSKLKLNCKGNRAQGGSHKCAQGCWLLDRCSIIRHETTDVRFLCECTTGAPTPHVRERGEAEEPWGEGERQG